MSNNNLLLPTRRNFIKSGGQTMSLAGLTMLLGTGKAVSATSSETKQDIQILNAAIALEHEGIAAYQIAATSGLLQKPIVDIGITFQSHHKGHRDILMDAVKQLGGKPAEEKSLSDYAQDLNVSMLKNQEDVLRLALKLERGAAMAYLGLIPSLGVNFHQVAAQMAGDEVFHAAILANALGDQIPEKALIFG